MTERLFWQDPYLLEFDARVVARQHRGDRTWVALDRTAFYPESGGQPWDTGTLDGVRVSAVVAEDGVILHELEGVLARDEVRGRVDAERRRDHRQQHHGQHLLSRAFRDLLEAATASFHLGSEECSIDLSTEVTREGAHLAERRANEIVWEARPVSVETLPRREAESLGLDPKEHVGDAIRVVVVEGFDRNPCGGTHPRNTSEVGVVVVLGLERHKGGSRVRFVCGHRALARLAERNRTLDELVATLQAPIPSLPDAAREKTERLSEADRRGRELLEWALEGEAHRLLSETTGTPPLIVKSYLGFAPADLRTLALKLTRTGPPCVALLGSRAEKAHLVFARSDALSHDVGKLLEGALSLLGGRGGGRGGLVQGGGERVDLLDQALAAAADEVRRAS